MKGSAKGRCLVLTTLRRFETRSQECRNEKCFSEQSHERYCVHFGSAGFDCRHVEVWREANRSKSHWEPFRYKWSPVLANRTSQRKLVLLPSHSFIKR